MKTMPIKIDFQEIYVVDEIGNVVNLTNASIIQDYRAYKELPSVDKLLDWKLRLKELKAEKYYPKSWFVEEELAVDYLL